MSATSERRQFFMGAETRPTNSAKERSSLAARSVEVSVKQRGVPHVHEAKKPQT